MSWIGAFGVTASGLLLRNILNQSPSPTKVLEVKLEQYDRRHPECREDSIVLYNAEKGVHEIVLQRPFNESIHEVYSLFRSKDHEEAKAKFLLLKDKIPILVHSSKEVSNLSGIQKLCDAIELHPSWLASHLAAFFNLNTCFEEKKIKTLINTPEEVEGMSPLQVAIKSNHLVSVQTLIQLGASLEHFDYDENSVFHYAAESSKEVISAIASAPKSCLNCRNANGHTPLHVACMADKPECVKALLISGADVNISATQMSRSVTLTSQSPPGLVRDFLHANPNTLQAQDMKFGGTPLHWSSSREVIITLVEMGVDINAINFKGGTALHMMVLRDRLECVVALLAHGALVNTCDQDGNTPLHSAVKQNNATLVQALIVFGADIDNRNKMDVTPRHAVTVGDAGGRVLYLLHSVGAQRCLIGMQGCNPGCSSTGSYNGVPPPSVPVSYLPREIIDQMVSMSGMARSSTLPKPCGGRVLCLDGGGIRGLILIVLLLEIERITERPIVHCFDWIAGTSTGGILALALGAGKTVQECLCLYFRLKQEVFQGWRPYNSNVLESLLQETLGEKTVMTDIKNPKIMITAVLAERYPVELHMFRNYPSANELLSLRPNEMFSAPPRPEAQLLWKAARATGAAPSYFRAFEGFLDGGLIANNPTLDAYTEITEYHLALEQRGQQPPDKPVSVIISLGTGMIPVTQPKNEIDVFRPENIWDTAKVAFGITAIGTLLVDQATLSDGRVVDRARAIFANMGIPYFRFSPQLSEVIAMDEHDDEKLINMLWETKAYMYENRHTVYEALHLLLSIAPAPASE